jgi:hypothetical protein
MPDIWLQTASNIVRNRGIAMTMLDVSWLFITAVTEAPDLSVRYVSWMGEGRGGEVNRWIKPRNIKREEMQWCI